MARLRRLHVSPKASVNRSLQLSWRVPEFLKESPESGPDRTRNPEVHKFPKTRFREEVHDRRGVVGPKVLQDGLRKLQDLKDLGIRDQSSPVTRATARTVFRPWRSMRRL